MTETVTRPSRQYLDAGLVIEELAEGGRRSVLTRSPLELLLLAVLAGAFITAGAFFSLIITAEVDNRSARALLDGFGFSTGFFVVILSGALLFTEANVELPATLIGRSGAPAPMVVRMWGIAAAGNLIGAVLLGLAIGVAAKQPDVVLDRLAEVVRTKASFREVGGAEGWFRAVLSGVLGNWLVGMAAFLATMGRTIVGRYIPVLIVVTMFVASGFLHSPANMAFVALAEPAGVGIGWGPSLAWAIAPAAIGNIIGGFLLVALPYAWLSMSPRADTPSDAEESR